MQQCKGIPLQILRWNQFAFGAFIPLSWEILERRSETILMASALCSGLHFARLVLWNLSFSLPLPAESVFST